MPGSISRSRNGNRSRRPDGGDALRVRWARSGAAVAALTTVAISAFPSPALSQVRTVQPGPPGGSVRVLTRDDLSSLSGPEHTAADARFMQGMIVHHEQAILMAALVPARSVSRDVPLLARRIELSQIDEIRLMERWLESRGESRALGVEAPAGARPDASPASGAPTAIMPGMLSADQMAALEGAEGAEFDRLLLEGMIQHHEGALEMVSDLLGTPAAGQESEISAFASHVHADQSIEIRRITQMLAGYPDRGSNPG